MAWVRARQLQLLLAQIDRLPEADRRAVYERIQPLDIAHIQRSGALDWVAMRLSVELARAVIEILGRERARAFFRAQFAVTLQNAVLGSLVAAVSRYIISADPRPALRWLPRGHDLLFQGVGRIEMTFLPDKCEATLTLVDLPPELAADRMWLDRYAWSVEAIRGLSGMTLDCEVTRAEPEARLAAFRLTWPEPPRSQTR